MNQFFAGVIVGIVISTVGVSGIAKLVDGGVAKLQDVSRETVKDK
jgi:hypothetical protein